MGRNKTNYAYYRCISCNRQVMKVSTEIHVCERERDGMGNIVVTPTIEDNDNDLTFRESWSEASVSIENYNENNGELDIKFSDFENDSSNESGSFIRIYSTYQSVRRNAKKI